jgi:drug/metabolite transporter (DMT)-like permease
MLGSHVGELAALATALLWTLSALAWTSAGKRIGSLSVSFLRLPIAVAMMMVYGQVVRGRCLPTDADAHTWFYLGISGLFGYFLCDLFLFKAMLLIGPRLVLLIFSLTPPLTAVISWIWMGDKLNLWDWTAMAVTLAGVAWVVLERSNAEDPSHAPHHKRRGVVLALLATFANAIGVVFSSKGLGEYDAVAATQIRVLAALPAYILLITLWHRWPAIQQAARQARAMIILTFGATVGPFVGVSCFMVALRYSPAGVATTITASMPVLIVPFTIVLYHEKVSLRAVGGAVVAVAGIAMLMLKPI